MRHRASRPLVDAWQHVPRATARLLGEVAGLGRVRPLVALVLVLGLGTGGFLAVASVMSGASDPPAESAGLDRRLGPTASRGGSRLDELPRSDGSTPTGRSAEPKASADPKPEKPSPTARGELTVAPRTGTARPSTSPLQPSATASTTPDDATPPNTSLSEEFPAGTVARFSFSANEAASFTCSLDGAAYTPCESPVHYSALDPGWHTFAVRATDAAGNVDPSPATVRWESKGGGPPEE